MRLLQKIQQVLVLLTYLLVLSCSSTQAASDDDDGDVDESESEENSAAIKKAAGEAGSAFEESDAAEFEEGSNAAASSASEQEDPAPEDSDPIAAAAAAEAQALTGDSSGISGDIVPVGEGSDQIPTDLTAQTASNAAGAPVSAAPTAASVAAPSGQAPDSSPPAPQVSEVEPVSSILRWVGYRIKEKERELKVELLSQGHPDFEVLEETNRAQQLELVLRFYQTRLRRKIRWDINSSEFRSPLAYIRMREFKDRGVVDVVLTHRDPVLPLFYAKDGRMLLVYTIPEQYFNKGPATARNIKERAISLVAGNDAPLHHEASVGPNGPEVLGHRSEELFPRGHIALRPIKEYLRPAADDSIDDEGLPEDFDRQRPPKVQRAAYHIQEFSLSSVGQDDLDTLDVEEEFSNAEASPAENSTTATAPTSKDASNAAIQDVPTETSVSNAAVPANPSGNAASVSEPAPLATPMADGARADAAGQAAVMANGNAAAPTQPAAQGAAGSDTASNIAITDEAAGDAAPAPGSPQGDAPAAPAPIEMTGQNNPSAGQPYVGRPIFMEFYDAPLSLVLKSFSEETGNNFVYSSQVGSIPVTVHFKGVPWDEALKAILETYSLGMVRIGENVVRIDQIANLTNYMQALEQAKLFELRRIPTKVLVFRLNNAVATDIATRLTGLLARDIEVDSRTKIQADPRTNAVVMEASTQVLAKAKAIIERLDLETPQVEIASRIVEVQKTQNNFFGFAWANSLNYDPGRALGFGTLNFPNSVGSSFAVDPGVAASNVSGVGRFRFGSLNKFVDLDLLLKMEEKKGTTNVLQSNRVLVLDGQKASVLAGNSRFFRPAAGAVIPGSGGGVGGSQAGLAEVKFNLQLDVKPQITALGSVIMELSIKSDTPGDTTGEVLASKNTRELNTQMVRDSGDTGVIGGIYDTNRSTTVTGVPLLSDIPILGALFRSTQTVENQTELLIMVTPTIVSGRSNGENRDETAAAKSNKDQKAM